METVKDYRDVISEALGQRLAHNPNYSLRAQTIEERYLNSHNDSGWTGAAAFLESGKCD